MIRRPLIALALVAAILACAFPTNPAVAAEVLPSTISTTAPDKKLSSETDTEQQNGAAPVIVVLDLSGSMNDDDGSGLIKLTGAKKAVDNAIRNIPSTQQFGLWTYPGGSDDCGSGAFIVAPSPISDVNGTIRTVDALTADGGTPTGPALLGAVDTLKAQGTHAATLVLVSDGESNCGQSPCDVAEQLVGTGFDVTIHTVGFRVSEAGRSELNCVAEATGGRYIDAEDGDQLNTTLRDLTRSTLQVRTTGTLQPLAGLPARITATVTNRSTITATDVQLTLDLAGRTPPGLIGSLRVGNLRPGASVERSWTIGTGAESLSVEGSTDAGRAFTLSSWARNADRVSVDGTIGGATVRSADTRLRDRLGAILRAPIDAGHPVVIMGDSYSAGEGTFDYTTPPADVNAGCHRSDSTYLVPELDPGDAINLACSGAVAWDFYYPGRGYPGPDATSPQLDQVNALQEAPGAVVMTLGGNDIGFEHIIKRCILIDTNIGCDHDPRDLATWVASADSMRTWLAPVYEDVWRAINTPARREQRNDAYAPVIVLAYPQVTHATKLGACGSVKAAAGLKGVFGPGEVRVANELAAHLNAAIKAAVADARDAGFEVYFVPDTADVALPNHTLCNGDESYINGVVGLGDPESLHPNVNGYAAETGAIISWSESVTPEAPQTDRIASQLTRTTLAPWGVRYPTPSSSDGLLLQGGPVEVQGNGYLPGSPVTFTVHSTPVTLGTLLANDDGNVQGTLRIPFAVSYGEHELVVSGASGEGAHREERTSISVLATPPLWIELALPLAGLFTLTALVLLVFWWRERKLSRTQTKADKD